MALESYSTRKITGKIIVNLLLVALCVIWLLPTFGVFITSFRHEDVVTKTGWWTVFGEGFKGMSTDNYRQVLGGKDYVFVNSAGEEVKSSGDNLYLAFLNTLTVTVPSVFMPILIAAFSAYGFAWLNFRGRKLLFTGIVALLVVPLQISLIPVLRDYRVLQLNGTYLGIWLAHTGFGLPLAVFLLYNFVSSIPKDIMESAFIDGATHYEIFYKLIMPLSVPALASYAIFQFMWVWNDLLVSLVFLGFGSKIQVMTMRLLNMVGYRGEDWHLLTSGAIVSMLIPLIIFFSMQRYFVRGLLAGSVKG